MEFWASGLGLASPGCFEHLRSKSEDSLCPSLFPPSASLTGCVYLLSKHEVINSKMYIKENKNNKKLNKWGKKYYVYYNIKYR